MTIDGLVAVVVAVVIGAAIIKLLGPPRRLF